MRESGKMASAHVELFKYMSLRLPLNTGYLLASSMHSADMQKACAMCCSLSNLFQCTFSLADEN